MARRRHRVFRTASVSYLRIPATDPKRSAAFYAAAFEWTVDVDRVRAPRRRLLKVQKRRGQQSFSTNCTWIMHNVRFLWERESFGHLCDAHFPAR
jgi:hypothetical protein